MFSRRALLSGGFSGIEIAEVFADGEDGFWLDLSDTDSVLDASLNPVTTNGEPIRRVLDQSPNATTFDQGTVNNRALWNNNGLSDHNHVSGTPRFWRNSVAMGGNYTAFTIMFALKLRNQDINARILWTNSSPLNGLELDASLAEMRWVGSGATLTGGGFIDLHEVVVTVVGDASGQRLYYHYRPDSKDWHPAHARLYLQDSDSAVGLFPRDERANRIYIGAGGTSSLGYKGLLAECIATSRALSEPEINMLSRYLGNRHLLTI